jgi:AhpD family alkylhydroperoxidase
MTHEPARLELDTFRSLAPETFRALLAISASTNSSPLGIELIKLATLRASRLNGCAFCLQMHTLEARKVGVTAERIEALGQWRDSPLFSARERAALAWTEALTHLSGGDVPDTVYREAASVFSAEELAALTSAVVTINAWNRISLAYRFQPSPDEGGRG